MPGPWPRPGLGVGFLALAVVVFLLATAVEPAGAPLRPAPAEPLLSAGVALPSATVEGEPLAPAGAEAMATQLPAPGAYADHEAAAGPEISAPAPGQAPTPLPVPSAAPVPEPVVRIGLQAGHWRSADMPDELARLRTSTGTWGGGVAEWEFNLDIANRVAALLEVEGVVVDVLPATVPPGYQADAFIALHADGDASGMLTGFKLARPRVSNDVEAEEALIAAITAEYARATGLGLDDHVSRNMTGYYAFSYRRFRHAVAAVTPSVILEMGFLTSAADRRTLLGRPEAVAEGIAHGVLSYLALRDQAAP